MYSSRERHTLFYGWWVVGACFLIMLYTGGVVFFGFTAVFEPIAIEFDWSYAQISFAASLRGLEMGILAPLAGVAVSRWGPRRLIFGGAILVGFGLMLLSQISSLGMFYGAFILIATGVSALSGTVLLTAVVNWFRKRVAIATGIAVSGFALGGVMVPLVTFLIDIYDWRMAMAILGLGTLAMVLPLSMVVRHKPERYGYLPHGDNGRAASIDQNLTPEQSSHVDIRIKEAATGRVFWRIALATMCHMLVVSAVVTHVMPYLTTIGINRSTSSLAASAIPLVSIIGRLGAGWLGDRFDNRRVTATAFVLMALGLLFFGYLAATRIWLVMPFLILFGIGWGGSVTMRAALLREYFGWSRFSEFYGFVMGIATLGIIAGAPLAGWAFDEWGTYDGIWFVFAGACFTALIIVSTIPPFQKYSSNHRQKSDSTPSDVY